MEEIDEFDLEDLEEVEPVEVNNELLNKKDVAKKRKQAENEADWFKKQVVAANNIALGCQWVLEQLAASRISEASSAIFDESHFQAVQLTANEISWLKAHQSVEKVLHLTCIAYAAAPKWEPYPQSILSVQDLEKIESERFLHRKAIEEANQIASQLLVRKGDNIDPTQQIIEFGMHNTKWISEQLTRAKTNAKEKKKKKKDTVAEVAKAVDTQQASQLHNGICDIVECEESAVGLCVLSSSNCGNSRFCSMQIAHSSHEWHKTKRVTVVISLYCMYHHMTYLISIILHDFCK